MEIKLGRSSGAPRQKFLLGLCLLVGLRAGSAMILGEALGATNAIWRTGGDAPWFVETNTIRGGLASLRSGEVAEAQESWLEVEVEGPAAVNSAGRGQVGISLNCQNSGLIGFFEMGSPWSLQALGLSGSSNVVRWTQSGPGVTWLDAVEIGPDTNNFHSLTGSIAASSGGTINVGSLMSGGSISLNASQIISGSGLINGVAMPNGGTIFGGVVITPGTGGVVVVQMGLWPGKGSYTGLFYNPDALDPESAGAFIVTKTANDRYSGKILLAGSSYSIVGKFDNTGRATNVVSRSRMRPLHIQLQLATDGSDRLEGKISNGSWTSSLLAHRALFRIFGTRLPCPYSGHYTLVIPGIPYDPIRAGNGYSTLKVDRGGNVRCSGSFANGRPFTQASTLSAQGEWPFYVSDRKRGLVVGWLTFTNQAENDVSGVLAASALRASGQSPEAIVADQFVPVGSRFEFQSGIRVLNWNTGTMSLAGGRLAERFTNDIYLNVENKILNQTDNNLVLALIKSNGRFVGKVNMPGTNKRIPIQGVLLQKREAGYGYFLQGSSSGSVAFEKND